MKSSRRRRLRKSRNVGMQVSSESSHGASAMGDKKKARVLAARARISAESWMWCFTR